MTTIRPLMAIATAALMLTTAACSSTGSPTESADSGAADTTCAPTTIGYGELDPAVTETPVDDAALVIYSGRSEDLMAPVLEDFTAATGIDVSVRYGSTAALTAQLLEEGDATPADVFLSQDAGALSALEQSGCLAGLPDAVTGLVGAQFQAGEQSWTPLTGRARTIVYNPNLIAEADLPSSLDELTDPAVASQLGVAPTNAGFQAFVSAIRALEGDDVAAQFLADLSAGGVQTFDSNGDITQAVNDGQLAMGLSNHYYLQELTAEIGADAVVARNSYPADGTALSLVNVSGAGVLSPSDRSEDALALLEYLLSDSAQEYFATSTGEYTVVDGAPQPSGAPALDQLGGPDLDLDELSDLQATIAMINESGLI